MISFASDNLNGFFITDYALSDTLIQQGILIFPPRAIDNRSYSVLIQALM